MATDLTGLFVADTYQSLLKIGDNSSLTGDPDRISDGFGNNSNLYLTTTQVSIGVVPASGYDLTVNGAVKAGSLYVVGNTTSNAFIKIGGNSSQFLKADGSVDSSVYLTSVSAAIVSYDNTQSGLVATNVNSAIDELQAKKVNITDLAANVVFYPTTAESGITNYFLLVDDVEDPNYNSTAVDIETPEITGDDQLIALLASAEGQLVGNTGTLNVHTIGNIRRSSGFLSGRATFYYQVYKRASNGTETLLSTSSTTQEVTSNTYEEFYSDALIQNATFTETDRVVLKFYGNQIFGSAQYEIQFGGASPVRSLFPVPITVIPSDTAEDIIVDTSNFNTLNGDDDNVQHALETIDAELTAIDLDYVTDKGATTTNAISVPSVSFPFTGGGLGFIGNYFNALQLKTNAGSSIEIGGNGLGSVQNNLVIKDGDLIVNGNATADSFIKDGGLSSEFLKADGSVDSNVYLTTESDTLDSVTGRGNTTANNITVGDINAGNLTLTGYIRGAANLVIDPAAHNDETGVVQILGDLRVDGTTTTINSTTVTIADKNIVLAEGSATAADANGAGITIDGADATMTYSSAGDRFVFNKDIETDLVGNASTASALQNARNIALDGDVTGNADFDGSGDITITTVVANDSHTHDGRYYTETESDTRFVNVTGDTMTGNLNFSETGEGVTWVMNTDGASIKFYNTGDADTNSRLEFQTTDNNNEYFRWTHAPSGGTVYELMRLTGNGTGGTLDIAGAIQVNDITIVDSSRQAFFTNATVGGTVDSNNFNTTGGSYNVDGTAVITSTGKFITDEIEGGTLNINGTTQINLRANGDLKAYVDATGFNVVGGLNLGGVDGISLTDDDSTIDSFFHANVNYDAGLYQVTSNARYGSDYIQVDGLDTRTNTVFVISPKETTTTNPDLYLGGDFSLTAPNTLVNWRNIEMNATSVQINNQEVATQSWVNSNIDLQTVTDNGATTDVAISTPAVSFPFTGGGLGRIGNYFNALQIKTNAGSSIEIGGDGTGSVQNNLVVKNGDLTVKRIGSGEPTSVYPTGNWAAQIFTSQDSVDRGGLVVGNRWANDNSIVFQAGNLYNAWRPYLTVKGGGSVGIGTTTPSNKLEIVGSNALRIHDGTDQGSIFFRGDRNDVYIKESNFQLLFGAPSGMVFEIDSNNNDGDSFNVTHRGTSRFYINGANGNVGIGTTSPAARLDVRDTSTSATQINLENNSTGGGAYRLQSTGSTSSTGAGKFSIYSVAGVAHRFTIDTSGNVGIGTTSPAYKLHVVGDASISNGLTVGNVATYDYQIVVGTNATVASVLRNSAGVDVSTENTKIFRVKLVTRGTGTDTSWVGLVSNVDGSGWTIKRVYSNVETPSSNYPYMFIDSNGLPSITLSHPSNYSVGVYVEEFNGGNTGTLPGVFGLDSVISGLGGNIGIGTTSPSTKFHVSSTGANAYSSTITKGSNMKGIVNTLSNNADDMVGIYFATGETTEGAHWSGITGSRSNSATDWSTQLNFYTHDEAFTNINDATQKMVIKGNGNVGIGTTSPSKKLHVAGSDADGLLVSGGTNGRSVFVNASSIDLNVTTNSGYAMALRALSTTTGGVLGQVAGVFGTSPTAATYYYYGGTDYNSAAMYILTNNNVGIGTTTPSWKLDVNEGGIRSLRSTAGWAGWFENTGNSSGVVVTAGVDSNNAPLLIRKQDGTELFSVRGNGTSWFNNGNVGIGTTSPSAPLQISVGTSLPVADAPNATLSIGSISSSGTPSVLGRVTSNVTGVYILASTTNTNTSGDMVFNARENNNSTFATLTNSAFKFQHFTTDLVNILRNGNVGIGTTSPDDKLHVIGNVRADSLKLPFAGGYLGEIGHYFGGLQIRTNAGGAIELGGAGPSSVQNDVFVKNGKFVVENGNVGIGTTTPATKLDVNGAGTFIGNIALITDATSGNYSLIQHKYDGVAKAYSGYNSGFAIYGGETDVSTRIQSGGQYAITALTNGNVGIGTTSPSEKLDVAGDIRSSQRLWLQSIDAISISGSDLRVGYSNSNLLLRAGSGERMRITSVGNVGIGTTSPYSNLHVVGTIKVATGNAQGILGLGEGNGTTVNVGIWRGAANAPTTDGNYLNLGGYDGIVLATGNAAIGSQTERMRITSAGNVGIGTTSPNKTLEVNGTWQLKGISAYGFESYTYGTQLNVSNLTSGGWARANRIVTSDSTGSVFFGVYGGGTTMTYAYWNIGNSASESTNYNNSTGIILKKDGSVGIGTTAPAQKLDVNGAIITTDYRSSGTFYLTSGNDWRFRGTGGTEFARLNSTGLGIGTTTPAQKLHVQDGNIRVERAATGLGGYICVGNSTENVSNYSAYHFGNTVDDVNYMKGGIAYATIASTYGRGDMHFLQNSVQNNSNANLSHSVMVIKNDGKIGINKSVPTSRMHIVANAYEEALNIELTANANLGTITMPTYAFGWSINNTGFSGTNAFRFQYNGTLVGRIGINSTSTTYATTSDYRVKENLTEVTDGIERLKQLKPKRFNFIGYDEVVDGFIAHEAAEVVPEAVIGEKDAVDKEGNPELQGIDQSKLVPLLTAALQQAVAKIEELEQRILTLENK